MKNLTKLACIAALTSFAIGATAHADVDDNFPWKAPGGTMANVSLLSRAYSGNVGFSGGSLAISSSTDVDYHVLSCGKAVNPYTGLVSSGIVSSITVEFTHSKGDLDIAVYGPEGNILGVSAGSVDNETLGIASFNRSTAVVRIYGYKGATNTYGLSLVCK